MHLSFLDDDRVMTAIATMSAAGTGRGFGRAHRDGLLRGTLFLLALVIPLALTVALSPAQAIDQAPTATHVPITHLQTR